MASIFDQLKSEDSKRTKIIFDRGFNTSVPGNSKELLIVDATPNRSHNTEATPTENPVEEGVDISDHVDVRPRGYSMSGIVTDSPITLINALISNVGGLIGGAVGGFAGALVTGAVSALGGALLNTSKNRSADAYNTLLEIQGYKRDSSGQISKTTPIPVKIVAGLTVYENMILKSLKIDENATTGKALNFSAVFQEIRIATVSVIKLPKEVIDKAANHSASGSTKNGKQNTNESGTSTTDKFNKLKGKSALKLIFGS